MNVCPIIVEQSHTAANHHQAAFRRSQSEPIKTSLPPIKVSEVSLNMSVSLLYLSHCKVSYNRFQLFGGVKKTGEPSAAEDTPTKSPKKDKGKRRLFGRAGAKENFVGRPNLASHRSDPQVARMTGDSFERESIDLEEDSEFL
ncbi:uncharacterized protein LOC134766645 [Penaeus indicus]|uniref:uncharacterized protein LOC134766645 n=1 Tax=Penaeus indicus TaxID=29960 RepID=UPI00300C6E93